MATSPTAVAGAVLTGLSVLGYLVGVATAYPGRAFSLTGLMVGLTLLAVGAGRQRGERG
ncbi:hypothetical protein ACFO0N_13500 [Halobium salinum]|uniref:Uncharacterized protein n=1 Tax=Halobium salinum TaxID=1364940 RepID=A0ABD5PE80_9EURY|nr:hypothetical protein [Halobium salinum]